MAILPLIVLNNGSISCDTCPVLFPLYPHSQTILHMDVPQQLQIFIFTHGAIH
jgi:hypothetical protein